MKASRNRVYIWVAICWVAMLAASAAIVLLFIRALLPPLLAYEDTVGNLGIVWSAAIFAAISLFITYRRVAAQVSKMGKSVKYTDPSCEGWRLACIVEDLCKRRNHPLPDIVLVDHQPTHKVFSPIAGMIDRPVRRDIIIIGRDLIRALLPSHMQGVMAHELRHSDAEENKLEWVTNAFKAAAFFIILWGGINFVFHGGSLLLWIGFAFNVLVTNFGFVTLLKLFVSRMREFKTDALGCLDVRNPRGLIETLYAFDEFMRSTLPAAKRKSLEFQERYLLNILATHPTTASRTRILRILFDLDRGVQAQAQQSVQVPLTARP